MRRYATTIILLIALLAVGGLAVANDFDPMRVLFKGTYQPNMNAEFAPNVSAALGIVVGVPVIIGLVLGLGVALGFGFQQATKMEAAFKAKEPAPAKAAAKPVPAPKGPAPDVPFTTNRSLIVFWVVTVVTVTLFMAFRFREQVQGVYLPMTSFGQEFTRIPGEAIEGLPAFIPGPGSRVVVWQAFVPVALGLVVVAGGAGFGLARLFNVMDTELKTADKMPRTGADALIAAVDQQIHSLLSPKPAATPANAFDQILVAFDVALVLVVLAIIAAWVVPQMDSVAAIDQSIAATKIAASWTPTPLPGPSPTPGPSPDQLFALLPVGDAANGQTLTEKNACAACHITPPPAGTKLNGVPWVASLAEDGKGIADHAAERITASDYKGKATTPTGYLLESIINPSAYVVRGYQPNVMPQVFGTTLAPQDLADIIAYLSTLK